MLGHKALQLCNVRVGDGSSDNLPLFRGESQPTVVHYNQRRNKRFKSDRLVPMGPLVTSETLYNCRVYQVRVAMDRL